jgi:hypothetical protein
MLKRILEVIFNCILRAKTIFLCITYLAISVLIKIEMPLQQMAIAIFLLMHIIKQCIKNTAA